MDLESHAAICTTHWEMLRVVIGGTQCLSRSEEEKDVRGQLHWRWQCVPYTMAFSDIEELGHHFVGNVTQDSSRTPAAPAPTPTRAPAPAPAPAPGLATPAATLPWVSSVMEQRPLARLAAAGHGSSSHEHRGGGGGIQPVTHHVALQQELVTIEGKTPGQTYAASRCQVLGSARASRRLLRARASLWRHRICPISHSLLVFTTGSRRSIAKRSATFLRCLF